MTTEALQATAERIVADRDFARRVYEAGEEATPFEYDLDPAEWQAVHRALAADVEAASGEVAGYSFSWGAANLGFTNVQAVADAAKGKGKASMQDFHFTHVVDKSSPIL